jgi:phosphoglycolate phosphatase-like HAD superfamily hydrolase
VTATDFVIFDLDGTLIDSAPDIAWALGTALTEAGVEPPPLDQSVTFPAGADLEAWQAATVKRNAVRDENSQTVRAVGFEVISTEAMCGNLPDSRRFSNMISGRRVAAIRREARRDAVRVRLRRHFVRMGHEEIQ